MRARPALALGALLVSASACPQTVGPTLDPEAGADAGEADVDTALFPAEPANVEEGDPLEATIPLADGRILELASLRGGPILLEISASDEQGWEQAHLHYAQLLAAHPELTVIVVAAEAEDRALLELPEGLIAGWDPAGALAAKLTVATFPTMFVIGPDGRIVTVVNGWSDAVQADLDAAIDGASN